MTNPANSAVQNLLPVQAYFNVDGSFNTFIGQGVPFYATSNPVQSGLTITNSTLNSSPIGGTSPSTGVFTNIATTTGTISTNASSATDIVNLLTLQSYAAGISWKNPVTAATTTNITLSGLQTVDTVSLVAGNTVLVKNQTDNTKNGIYQVNAGAWTYATGSTTWAQYVSALVFVEYGTQAGSAWYCSAQPGGTLGTTAMVWSNFSVASTYTAGTGLTLAGYQFSITNTGVAANTYGSATASPVFAVNAQGQITSVTNTTITPAIGNVTGLATGIATFLQTPTSANLAAAVSDETGSGSLVFATSPTLVTPALGTPASGVMTNVTGLPLTTGVTGTLPIGNGGTGQTTASTAFNALSPITTAGDLIIGNGTNSATRLGIGSNNYVLTSNGTTASWAAIPSSMVYPGAGIPNSTGSAWGTSYSTTGSGTVVALATSPVFVTPTLGVATATSITAGFHIANGTITGSLNAGAFSYGTLGYSDIDIFSSYTLSVNNYVQKILQNTNSGTAASADFVISNNLGTASTYYGDFGITSSGYNTPGQNITNTPNTVYLQAVTTGLAIGTLNANTTTFYANSTQSAQISTAGVWSFANDATINGLTAGQGKTSGVNGTAFGNGALGANTGSNNTAVGYLAGANNTSGGVTAFGQAALNANTTGANNSSFGQNSLSSNTTGGANTAVGQSALAGNTTASNNTAVGYQAAYSNTTGLITVFGKQAGYSNTTGTDNCAIGDRAFYTNTTGIQNSVLGTTALYFNTTGNYNVAVGTSALQSNTTASNNTAVGYQAGYSNTTGTPNESFGYKALYSNSTGIQNSGFGYQALTANTTGSQNQAFGTNSLYQNTTGNNNSAFGAGSLPSNTTGGNNAAFGFQALQANTTASNNTAVGYQAGYSNTTGANNVYLGYQAGYSNTSNNANIFIGYQAGYTSANILNVCVGTQAGYNLTSGTQNTFIGSGPSGVGAGQAITTGSYNTILGAYNGNQGGLDIRTANNWAVLSDGSGNVKFAVDASGNGFIGSNYSVSVQNNNSLIFYQAQGSIVYNHASGTGSGTPFAYFGYNGGSAIGTITQNGTTGVLYNITSDYRLKDNPQPLTGASEFIMALQPKTWDWWDGSGKGVGFIAHEFMEVAKHSGNGKKDEVDVDGNPIYQSIQPSSSEIMANLVALVQELKAEVDTLKAQLGAK